MAAATQDSSSFRVTRSGSLKTLFHEWRLKWPIPPPSSPLVVGHLRRLCPEVLSTCLAFSPPLTSKFISLSASHHPCSYICLCILPPSLYFYSSFFFFFLSLSFFLAPLGILPAYNLTPPSFLTLSLHPLAKLPFRSRGNPLISQTQQPRLHSEREGGGRGGEAMRSGRWERAVGGCVGEPQGWWVVGRLRENGGRGRTMACERRSSFCFAKTLRVFPALCVQDLGKH